MVVQVKSREWGCQKLQTLTRSTVHHGWSRTAALKAWPKLALAKVVNVFTFPVMLQSLPWMYCSLLLLVTLCLAAAANVYIVVSQDVITVAVVLKVHVLVGTSKNLYCLLYPHQGISTYCNRAGIWFIWTLELVSEKYGLSLGVR